LFFSPIGRVHSDNLVGILKHIIFAHQFFIYLELVYGYDR